MRNSIKSPKTKRLLKEKGANKSVERLERLIKQYQSSQEEPSRTKDLVARSSWEEEWKASNREEAWKAFDREEARINNDSNLTEEEKEDRIGAARNLTRQYGERPQKEEQY